MNRAKEHLAEFERAVLAFLQTEPYGAVGTKEVDEGEEYLVWRFQINATAPARLGAIAGDIVHNARAALDLLACQFVSIAGGTDADINRGKFPFGQNKAIFESELKDKLKKIRASARRFIKRLKPYKGGNRTLWLLHAADLRDKHRLLIPVGAVDRHITIMPNLGLKPGDKIPTMKLSIKRNGFLEDGEEIFRFPVLPYPFEKTINYQFRFEICLHGVEGLPEEPAMHTLMKFVSYAEKIVAIAERRRLI